MNFVHADPEWFGLLRIVAEAVDRPVALVEKDYWVTHTLWALHHQGFEVWFKGGTSLSKGFGLIERFSEDIDVRLDAGISGLQAPALSWKNSKAAAVAERDRWFDRIASELEVDACEVKRDSLGSDARVLAASFIVEYPALHADQLPKPMRPFVLLEVGRARVNPYVAADLSSWVHDHLEQIEQIDDYIDNRPRSVRCIHPWVTCLEKIDAIAVRFDKGKEAPDFARHYEDAARILRSRDRLPELEGGLDGLVAELATDDKKRMPAPDHPSLLPTDSERWIEINEAWEAIKPLFWGSRISLNDACAEIREFVASLAGDPG